jgi:S-DNA-T family DNA segregation ATPase FtsK/SpoIIIE
MLYLSSDAAKPTRLQGCYITHEEMARVVHFWKGQQQPQAAESAPTLAAEDLDPLFEQARQLLREHKHVSASFLQRQLRIGRGRAEQLLELVVKEDNGTGFPSIHEEAL